MKMKHLLAGEHPNAMDVTTRYKSAPKVVKLFVKHNCVRHIRSRAGSKTCFIPWRTPLIDLVPPL